MLHRSGIVQSCLAMIVTVNLIGCCSAPKVNSNRWHGKYMYVKTLPPITFHYDHGVLAGSYPNQQETIQVRFNDVCAYLGHVCLCGAGGYKIAELAVDTIQQDSAPLERGDFILISGKDHTVSDVIAAVLGCERRADIDKNRYFIDESIKTPKREYHYYIAYPAKKLAVHIVYQKHLLIGNEEMDKLWDIECAFENNRDSVDAVEIKSYRTKMAMMIADVFTERVYGLITASIVPYDEFEIRLSSLRQEQSEAR